MGILVFLKTILDIRNIGRLFLDLRIFLKKNELLPVVYALPIVFCILYYLSCYFFIKDNEINVESKRASIDNFIDLKLKKCGDKTAISVSIVHSNQLAGRFFSARVCDKRLINSDCILDLKSNKPLIYGINYRINPTTRDFLKLLAEEEYPRKIPLNKDGEQYIDDQIDGTAIVKLIQATDWWQEGIAKNLWITASKSGDKILYVFTFKTAVDRTQCDTEIHNILLELKQKMKERKWWFLQY